MGLWKFVKSINYSRLLIFKQRYGECGAVRLGKPWIANTPDDDPSPHHTQSSTSFALKIEINYTKTRSLADTTQRRMRTSQRERDERARDESEKENREKPLEIFNEEVLSRIANGERMVTGELDEIHTKLSIQPININLKKYEPSARHLCEFYLWNIGLCCRYALFSGAHWIDATQSLPAPVVDGCRNMKICFASFYLPFTIFGLRRADRQI